MTANGCSGAPPVEEGQATQLRRGLSTAPRNCPGCDAHPCRFLSAFPSPTSSACLTHSSSALEASVEVSVSTYLRRFVVAFALCVAISSAGAAASSAGTAEGAPVMLSAAAAPVKRPVVSGLSPSTGPTAGGTVVTITGRNLAGASRVLFGSTPGTGVKVLSANKISVKAPKHAGGKVNVRVTTKGGTSVVVARGAFSYVLSPVVSGLSPSTGPTAGGTLVTITGVNLSGATQVLFGSKPATELVSASATRIQVRAPGNTLGVTAVRVVTAGGTSVQNSASSFEYTAPWRKRFDLGVGTSTSVNYVSCASASFCAATTWDGRALFFNGSAWSAPTKMGSAADAFEISCPAVNACFAIVDNGTRVVFFNGTTWTTSRPAESSDWSLGDISCPSVTFCMATGEDLWSVFNGTSWTTTPAEFLVYKIDCVSSTFCAGIDMGGKASIYDGTGWKEPISIMGSHQEYLQDVSCVSARFCMATMGDWTGASVIYNGRTWEEPVRADPLHAVSCASVSFCAATVTYLGFDFTSYGMGTYDSSGWTTLVPPGPKADMRDVSCVSATFCVAVGGSTALVGP
ncbi:hypothetical protein D1871_07095 [Nakamurella silvestris]|nr:hypothetical protein D1871_07095 [Nakamurella silvestris]